METLLRNSSMQQLKEYYYDAKGEYPPRILPRKSL